MRTKLVYTAPAGVTDSLDEPVTDPKVLAALADISVPDDTTLEYMDPIAPDQAEFRGGYLRLALDGQHLRVRIEIDCPRKLKPAELAALRRNLDGQVSDGIGEGGFDFIEELTGVSVIPFPDLGRGKSTLAQTTGEAWQPGRRAAENAANRKRCRAVAAAVKAAEKAADAARGKRNPGKLFKLIAAGDRKGVAAEIAHLGGDLSFIASGQLPYERLFDRPLLRLLLDAGLNPNQHDRDGHSLLWLAAGSVDCLTLLLDRGTDIDLRNTDVDEDTALMQSAWQGHAKSVRLLLDRGADPFLKSRWGDTALDQATKKGYGGDMPGTIRILKAAMMRK